MKPHEYSQLAEDKPTILVVDDNADQWFLIRWALLLRYPEAEISWLSNAPSVLPYLESHLQRENDLPRMILVDLYLPSAEEGLNVLQLVKSHPVCHNIPAVMLSWSNDAEDIAEAYNHLADAYLIKPTSYRDWLSGLAPLDIYWGRSRSVY